ncbi:MULTISPECIES: DoxX family protein [Winogradskyella]|uniref:DoxX family protein n=1 Tax=Winogradskyella TaxID=286104 RepID=UPI0015CDF2A6|nr:MULTISPECIES: DoxX family protein [Winogradskyella]QNK77915.1 DoxX family protein [Winogradskyella sp. PAMC22761]QXP79080.1 DoxX family protein [Winogradskyella sp. HaHa_3_26]
MNLFNKISNFVAAGLMLFFAIPKLVGVEKSVQGFKQFQSLVPLDPTVFRIFTGVVELAIALLLLAYAIKNINNLGKLAYFLLLSTMIGGLTMEFFARPKPEMLLVVIALVLSALSIYKLKLLLKK